MYYAPDLPLMSIPEDLLHENFIIASGNRANRRMAYIKPFADSSVS